MSNLSAKAYELRQQVLDMIMAGKSGHIGGDMSVMEILVTLYNRMNIYPENVKDADRDRFVLSKGHCVEALYAVLADKGFLDISDVIANYVQYRSEYIGHPHNTILGIEMNSGSLGHGLGVCVGMALAGKRDKKGYRVYTVMGDGELAEGSVWEAIMAAAHYRLDNLCAIVDCNGLQISGRTSDVMGNGNLAERFSSFGWYVVEVKDGNSIEELQTAFDKAEQTTGKPAMIIAHTVKGCGSAIMEDQASWHHKVPSAEEYERIKADFAKRKEAFI